MMRLIVGLALAAASWAQSVGTATRTVSFAPDEIVIETEMVTATDMLPEQAAGLLTALAVELADLKTVGASRDQENRLVWEFAFVRPFSQLNTILKQMEFTRRDLRSRPGVEMRYQFFLRASPKSVAATRKKIFSELLAEARRSSGSNGKLRSVVFEPKAEDIDATRSARVFGQASGALRYEFSVTAVFEND